MYLPIAIHKDTHSVYGVTIPDVPGCYSWGNTVDEAIHNAKEALYSHLQVMKEHNDFEDVRASQIEELSKDGAYAGAIWALVEVDAEELAREPAKPGS
jgi:predicted RNase H-like HicB family nuclease